MTGGIRAEVRVDRTASCALVAAARACGRPAQAVARSGPDGAGTAVVEFTVRDGPESLSLDGVATETPVAPIFGYDGATVYRVRRQADGGCPVDHLHDAGCPVVDASAREGALSLTFHAADMTELQSVMDALTDAFSVDVRRLLRTHTDAPVERLAVVDRSRLTDRQREVLETAYEMGYFEHPKRANAGDVATALDVSRSTVSEHLASAQSKLFDAILE